MCERAPSCQGRDRRSRHGGLIARVLEQLLPLDPDRHDEVEVYLAFNLRVHHDPALRVIRDDAETASRRAVRHAVRLLADAGTLGSGRDPEMQTDQTYPLIDGLALHGTLWPDRYPPAHLRRVLAAHLDGLREPARPGRT